MTNTDTENPTENPTGNPTENSIENPTENPTEATTMNRDDAGPRRPLHRSDDRVLGGVCSGLADYLGVDTGIVRLVTVLLVLFAGGGLAAYALAWLVVPDARGEIAGVRLAARLGLTRTR